MAFDSEYPHVVCCTRLEGAAGIEGENLFDIKFFHCDGEEQYFAVAATTQLFVAKLQYGQNPPFEILWWINAQHERSNLNSVEWTKDEAGLPLLCTAGSNPRHIAVIDVETGTTKRTLSGHGRSINDLAISPTNRNLLASASEDFSIRLWDLRYSDQPCVAILAGDGHRQPVLTCCFHASGNWLMTGGMDTAVALWAVPDTQHRSEDQEPSVIFHPHFYSAEVHDNLVDCIRFYDNMIISRCSKEQKEAHVKENDNEILIWTIDGFDGWQPATSSMPAPASSPDRYTRSAFSTDAIGFKRLATLYMPDTDRFYLRFGLYHMRGQRPMLCMGNQRSELYFWDLQRIEDELYSSAGNGDGDHFTHALHDAMQKVAGGVVSKAHGDKSDQLQSINSSSLHAEHDANNGNSSSQTAVLDPFTALEPHHTVTVDSGISDGHKFTSSTASWSPDGRWLISVGDRATMVIMYRGEETSRDSGPQESDDG